MCFFLIAGRLKVAPVKIEYWSYILPPMYCTVPFLTFCESTKVKQTRWATSTFQTVVCKATWNLHFYPFEERSLLDKGQIPISNAPKREGRNYIPCRYSLVCVCVWRLTLCIHNFFSIFLFPFLFRCSIFNIRTYLRRFFFALHSQHAGDGG